MDLRREAREANRTVEERMQIENDPDTFPAAANDALVALPGFDSQRETALEFGVHSMLAIRSIQGNKRHRHV